MRSSHLEKVLRHAERKFVDAAHRKPTDLLDLYRKFLHIEEHRLKLAHASGESGREIAAKRADLISVVLRQLWRGALENALRSHMEEAPRLALVAVGGFGRSELNPYSDVDILFIYTKAEKARLPLIQDIVEQVLYMLWDVGFEVGHATRTLEEVAEQANADLQTKTSLLEARLLCGDESIWEEFEKTLSKKCLQGREAEYGEWRLADQEDRHRKNGGTVFMQEPNVKTGCGGLRDYQNLLWIARVRRGLRSSLELQEEGLLTPSERKQIDKAYDFLLRVRSELHYSQKRKGDVLTLRLQGVVANNFRYQHKNIMRRIEALMKDYFLHAQQIFIICNALARRLAGENLKARQMKWTFLPGSALKSEKIDGLILSNNQLEAAEGSTATGDPIRLLRIFVLAQQRRAEIGPELALRIRRRVSAINRQVIYQPAVREIVTTLFSRKGEVGRIFRRMHELGILGRLIPEFAPLHCLVQHEFFHRYTADEHTLICLEMLDKIVDATERPFANYRAIMQKIERPDLLYLAMLLHDSGRSENERHHAEAGAVNAVRVARRMRFGGRDLSTLVFLVNHHLTLAETAGRRNLDDSETIFEFARVVQTQERLDMLMVLTFADGQGTVGQENWSDWKETLNWQLYQRTKQALAGEREFILAAQRSVSDLKKKISDMLGKEISDDELEAHFDNLPSRYFQALPEALMVRHVELVHQFLLRQFAVGEEALQPIIQWIDHEEQGHSEVIIVTWERERIFALITGSFASCDLSIWSADIFTRADNIRIDTFRVSTPRFQAVVDERDKDAFRKVLNEALATTGYDFSKAIKTWKKNSWVTEGVEFPTVIDFNLKASSELTILDLQTADRPGLLYRVTNCLAGAGMKTVAARVTTEKGAALDTFYLRDLQGRKITDEKELQVVARKLQKALAT